MKRYVCSRDGFTCLRIDRGKSTAYIRLKSEMLYLGVVLSYTGFELQSAKRRCKLAKAEFGNLRQVLRSNSALSLKELMRIYRACVWPIIEYGILGVGLDSRSLGYMITSPARWPCSCGRFLVCVRKEFPTKMCAQDLG